MAQIKIAEYTFDNSMGDVVLNITPTTIVGVNEDVVNGNITTRTVYIDDSVMPTALRFGKSATHNDSLLTVEYLNIDSNITALDMCFYRCRKLQRVNTLNWNTSNVTNFSRFCDECNSLVEIDVSHFNVGKANGDFYRMFNGVKAEVLDVSQWNVNTTDGSLNSMFQSCPNVKKLDLSNWKVKIVHTTGTDTAIANMFNGCSSLEYLDLSGFDFSEMNASMTYMFKDCSSLRGIKGIENFDVSKVTNFSFMFQNCSSLTKLDLRNWVTSSATSFSGMFNGCTNLEVLRVDNFDYKEKDTSGLVLNSMFQNCTKLKQIFLPKLTNKGLGNFNSFCSGCSSLEYISMPNFAFGNCTSMDGTFTNCTSLKMLDLTTLDSSTFYNKAYGISGIIKNITCPVYYNSNTCSSTDFTDIPNKTNLIDVQGRLMAVYDFNNSVTTPDSAYPVLTGSTVTKTIDTQGSESYITHRVIGVDVMPTEISFKPISGLLNVDYLAVTSSCTQLSGLFDGCVHLENINTFGWDTSNVQGQNNRMFSNCSQLTKLDMTWFNTSKITMMRDMFSGCSKLTELDLSSFNTENVTSFQSMFWECTNLVTLNVSSFNTEKCTHFPYMFWGCTSLQELDLTNFNTTKNTMGDSIFNLMTSDQIVYVHDTNWTLDTAPATVVRLLSTLLAKYTFDNSIGDCLPTFTGITTSDYKVNDIVNDTITTRLLSTDGNKVITKISFGSLGKTSSLLALDYLKIDKNITQMNDMFQVCSNVTSINAENWDTSNVTNMAYMLQRCDKLTEVKGLGTWDTSKVTAMDAMFQNKAGNIKEIENWDVSSCKNFSYMFANGGINSELNLSNWQPNNLENCQNMFANSSFTSINLSGWDVPKLNNMSSMFAGAGVNSKLISVNMSNWTMETPANMNSMFYNNSNLTSIDFTGSKMVSSNLQQTFQSCTKLTSLDVSGFDTSQCTNMGLTFSLASKLTTLTGIENWNTSKCTNMSGMFNGCSSLTSLDLSNWNLPKVTTMRGMFIDCTALSNLIMPKCEAPLLDNMQHMFVNCKNMPELDMSEFVPKNLTSIGYMFSKCTKLEYIDLSSFVIDKVTYIEGLFNECYSLKVADCSNMKWIPSTGLSAFYQANNFNTIALLYIDAEYVNKWVASFRLHQQTKPLTVYYYDADPSQLTPVEGVTFKKYQNPTTIQLPPHIQLHSLPDGTRDEVDIKTGILIRKTSTTTFDGSENWQRTSNFIYLTNGLSNYSGLALSDSDVLSITKEELIGDNTVEGVYIVPSTGTIRIRKNGITDDINTFKNYLKSNPLSINVMGLPVQEKLILNYNHSCDYGRILPTGMCDKYSVVDSMYTQTMTSILLDGANTWDAMEEFENTVKFTATGTTVGVEDLNMLGAGGLYCDNDLFPNINDDSDVPHCRVDEAGNKFYIYVDKEMLMSPDLIGWQIWLQENKFNLIYELAEHLTYVKPYEELDPTQARWEGMDCMRDGAIKYHTNSSDNITMYPTLEYVAPSINNFEVTMLEPNTDYTIYAEGINKNDTINLGGTDINFNNGTVYTSGDNQWLRIDNNDSFYNMVITKGDTTGEVVPYFEGMTSVENPSVKTPIVVNGLLSTAQGKWESNSNFGGSVVYVPMIDVKVGQKYIIASSSQILVAVWRSKTWVNDDVTQIEYADVLPDRPLIFTPDVSQVAIFMVVAKHLTDKAHEVELRMYEGEVDYGYLGRVENPKVVIERSTVSYTDLKLRSLPNGVKDTINVVTGEYVQRVGEVVLNGSEDWVLSAHDNSTSFYTPLNDLVHKEDYLNSISCDKFVTHTYEWTLHNSISLNGISAYVDWLNDYPNENWLYIKHADSESSVEKFKQWLKENPVTVQYELAEPITTKLDAQTLLAYTDGTINLSSDTGFLPTTHYTVPSTNTFHLPSMKTGTRYTLKYPSASGSIAIGDITYKISSDSMLFTTPLKINGDTSAIIFSDANPENVILLEGAYNKREVPFFTGVKSVKNPNITIIDQLSTESTTYNCETEIELRGLPNGVADKLDIIKGKLTTNVGIRPYQEGDENLPNTWTDGYETVYALSSPVVTNVAIDHPTVTTNSLIELSSDYLIPQLNYRAPSSNNFPLDLLQPNTTYTLYADTLASGSYTLGGTKTGVYSQPHIITLGDMTDNLLTFNGDLGLSNVMLVKGNSLKTTLPPYFLGIRSVTDGHLLVEGMAGEMNEITFDEGIVLRDCNGVKDTIDLITCILTKRTGEITLTGAEGWYRADNESTTDHNVFKLTLGGLKEALVMCDTLQSVFDAKMMDCIHAHTNELCIVIANATIGGDTVNALKSWLNQHPTTVVYQLRTPIEVQLENTWTTLPPTSYDNQTEISSTVSTNSLKPMISVTVATTTLEEIVSNLEAQNAQLEEENIATMLALTSVYETMVAPSVATTNVEPEPQATTYNMRRSVRSAEPIGMSVSPMGMVYAKLVSKGFKSIDEVPYNLQAEVMYALRGME